MTAAATHELTSGLGYSYQWYKDGAAISGATASVLTVSEAGSYTVEAAASDGVLTSTALRSAAVTCTVTEPETTVPAPTEPETIVPAPTEPETLQLEEETIPLAGGELKVIETEAIPLANGSAVNWVWFVAAVAGCFIIVLAKRRKEGK